MDKETRMEIRDFLRRVSEFKVGKPELLEFLRQQPYYDEGDENAPFFSEAFLYNLIGKDDARSILSMMRKLAKLSGAYRSDIIIHELF